MPPTGPNRFATAVLLAVVGLSAPTVFAWAADTPQRALARLAEALSQNDAPAALAVFDHSAKDYGEIEAAIQALSAQADILCAIEVNEDKTPVLDTDWYLQLKPRGEGGEAVRRRTRATVTFREIQGKWRITSFTPLSVLAPVAVR